MRRIVITMIATFAMMLSSFAGAVADDGDRRGDDRGGDTWTAERDRGSWDQDRARDGQQTADRDRRDRDRKDRDRKDRDKPEEPKEPEEPDDPCPGGLLVPLDPLTNICLILLPDDGDAADCPDGAIFVQLSLDPLVIGCISVITGDIDDGNGIDPGNGLDDERCEDGVVVPLEELAFVCLHLLDTDETEADCPDGAVFLAVSLDPLVNLCASVLTEADDANGNGLLDLDLLDLDLLDLDGLDDLLDLGDLLGDDLPVVGSLL